MADAGDTIQFLHRVPLFQGLNKRQLQKLAERFIERRYAAGDAIVTQGRGGEGFFILTSGKAEAVRTRVDGEQTIVNTFEPGDFFGEMALLDDEGRRTATVRAVTACTCLVLVRWDFLSILKEDAEMAVAILQELARRFRMALDRLQ